eukprot:01853.XXX_3023_2507_1 [CDS] Oithona nana genome sequencing.
MFKENGDVSTSSLTRFLIVVFSPKKLDLKAIQMIEKQQLRVMTLGKGDREQQFKKAFAMPTPAWFVNGLYKLLFLCQEELPTTDEVIDSLIYLRCQNSHFQVSYIGLSALHIFREVFLEIELLSALFD